MALSSSGTPQASQLFDPYGTVRYSNGAMPGSYAYAGQRADGATGLSYDVARYYDPLAGQFVSADPAGDGLNLYAYVKGNPETRTDPTGLFTGGICVGASGALPNLGGWVSGCVVVGWDPKAGWSAGVEGTGGGGPTTSGLGAGVNAGVQFSTAQTVDDLNGPFFNVGGSGSVGPWGLAGSLFTGNDRHGKSVWGLDLGYQPGAEVEVQVGPSDTKVMDLITLGSKAKHEAHQGVDSWSKGVQQSVNTVRGWAEGQVDSHVPWPISNGLDGQIDSVSASVNQAIANTGNWANQLIDNTSNFMKSLFGWAGW